MDKEKVVPLEDRLPQLKKERKQRANRRFAFYAIVFFILILIIVYFQSPLSKVRQITVEGARITSTDQIVKASGITKNTHIWDIRSNAVEKKIKSLSTVKSATVDSAFPNRVKIHVVEFTRSAYLSKGENFYPILQNGTIMGKMPQNNLPVDAPVLMGFKSQQEIRAVTQGLSALPEEIIRSISDIHYINQQPGDEDNLILYINNGNRIVASTATFAKNIRMYPEISARLPENVRGTIYLSVGSYFTPYENSEKQQKQETAEP
ncbi:FtsQ-type POTRA domain-containing protein [Sporolactobacillus sp. Y61]|jgi:cell division protein FtsQ|uniref:Cell division protein DivIB n=1 Tax=Sporolactobacillus sp. Y61 TaxID=3160863 RepID=A0AAU8IC77_9BACL|nr:FtsQ-type POTRA domain-containing protein [Sporolactobacillus sp. THM19-2]RYL92875.1 FtsQ-type POTRA domain-containing protein [Sporolactobacillus sp. THM19-2]